MNTSPAHFTSALYRFLTELEANNNRQWFNANKDRYINDVRDPMSRFIMAMQAPLKGISAHIVADPRPVGGSMLGSRKGHDRVIRSDGNDEPAGGVPPGSSGSSARVSHGRISGHFVKERTGGKLRPVAGPAVRVVRGKKLSAVSDQPRSAL